MATQNLDKGTKYSKTIVPVTISGDLITKTITLNTGGTYVDRDIDITASMTVVSLSVSGNKVTSTGAGYIPANTTATIDTGTLSVTGPTVIVTKAGYLTKNTAKTVASGSLANVATSAVTYASVETPILSPDSNGKNFLYINEGWYGNSMIDLGNLIPDDADRPNATSSQMLSGYEAYDPATGKKIVGTMQTISGSFTGGAVSSSIKSVDSTSTDGSSVTLGTTDATSTGLDIVITPQASRTAVTWNGNQTGLVDKKSGDVASAAVSATNGTAATYYVNKITVGKDKNFGSSTTPGVEVNGQVYVAAKGYTTTAGGVTTNNDSEVIVSFPTTGQGSVTVAGTKVAQSGALTTTAVTAGTHGTATKATVNVTSISDANSVLTTTAANGYAIGVRAAQATAGSQAINYNVGTGWISAQSNTTLATSSIGVTTKDATLYVKKATPAFDGGSLSAATTATSNIEIGTTDTYSTAIKFTTKATVSAVQYNGAVDGYVKVNDDTVAKSASNKSTDYFVNAITVVSGQTFGSSSANAITVGGIAYEKVTGSAIVTLDGTNKLGSVTINGTNVAANGALKTTSRTASDGSVTILSASSTVKFIDKPASGTAGTDYYTVSAKGSGSVSTGTGYITSGTTSSNEANTTAYISKGTVSLSSSAKTANATVKFDTATDTASVLTTTTTKYPVVINVVQNAAGSVTPKYTTSEGYIPANTTAVNGTAVSVPVTSNNKTYYIKEGSATPSIASHTTSAGSATPSIDSSVVNKYTSGTGATTTDYAVVADSITSVKPTTGYYVVITPKVTTSAGSSSAKAAAATAAGYVDAVTAANNTMATADTKTVSVTANAAGDTGKAYIKVYDGLYTE